jgi:hypothetical protein
VDLLAFEQIARTAGQPEVLLGIGPTMRTGDDVFNF